MTKLTAAQRRRLDQLATYLEGLPKGYRHFGMRKYVGAFNEDTVRYARFNGGVAECGTVACAVGHGPAAGILMPPRMAGLLRPYRSYGNIEAWGHYSALFVGRADDSSWSNPERFEWLFASDWQGCDNHHWGAAARIRYLLDKGEPPEDFEYPQRRWRKLYAPYRIDAKAKANA